MGVTDNMTQVRPAAGNLYIITTNEETHIINTTTVGSISMPINKTLGFAGIENNIEVTGIHTFLTLTAYHAWLAISTQCHQHKLMH